MAKSANAIDRVEVGDLDLTDYTYEVAITAHPGRVSTVSITVDACLVKINGQPAIAPRTKEITK